jgi:hypothetical protein
MLLLLISRIHPGHVPMAAVVQLDEEAQQKHALVGD